MTYHAGGAGGGGSWELELWGEKRTVPVHDNRVNALDRLYIPKVEKPTTWQDYDSPGNLVDNVFWQVVELFKSTED